MFKNRKKQALNLMLKFYHPKAVIFAEIFETNGIE